MGVVGVFDSGLGGLSVLREIRHQLPGDDLIYVADSGFAPYGDRPEGYVADRSIAIADFLVSQGADVCVVACNTATAVAVDRLRSHLTMPVVGIEPGIKPAVALTRSGVVGVLATTRTLSTARFDHLVDEHAGAARVVVQPCPGLAEQVERGELDTALTRSLVEQYVRPLIGEGADVLVLGCTHYTFVKPVIEEMAGAEVALVDPAAAVARQVARRLREVSAESAAPSDRVTFWTTGDVAQVKSVLAKLWGPAAEVRSLS